MVRLAIRNGLEYLLAVGFVRLMQVLPYGLAMRLARCLGFLAYDLIGYRKRVAIENLRLALGENGSPSMARLGYANFAMTLADLAKLPILDQAFIAKHVKISGIEYLDWALQAKKGAVLVTGHFGSWELMGWILRRLGYPLVFVIGKQRNPHVQKLINRLRSQAGIEMIAYGDTIRLVRALKANRFVAMLADQDAGKRGVFVKFFGKEASTSRLPAGLSLISGSPLMCGFIIRQGLHNFRIVIEPPIGLPDSRWSSNRVDSIRYLTQAYTSTIERYVCQYPDHWLWSHRRWKTQPRLEAYSP